ncbi:MAG: glutamine--fructose-6-phosphate transaminase (isomerizing) [Nanoarchaeota archaeon]
MCGIIGIVSQKEFSVNKALLSGLKRLEYRGYDSWGFATWKGAYYKRTGGIRGLEEDMAASTAISHTRWATNGGVIQENAHPQFNNEKDIFVVHNGIIENAVHLRQKLAGEGYSFVSETDTEVIPHLIQDKLNNGKNMKEALKDLLNELEGTFAILITRRDDPNIYAVKRDSPLVLGSCENKYILSSDVYAFSDITNKAVFFEDNEFAVVSPEGYEFFNMDGEKITKSVCEFKWEVKEQTKNNFPHYMLKEINEESVTAERLQQSLKTTQYDKLKKFADELRNSKRVVFVSCGTSYHAALVGAFVFNSVGIRSQAVIASEFENFVDLDSNTTVIAISQSGETMDVVVVIKKAAKMGAKVLSIVNVPYSTIQRHSTVSLEIMAGQEICVAATKTFTNQLITLFALGRELGFDGFDFEGIPKRIKTTIEQTEDKIKALAKELQNKEHIFVLGRGVSYPIAREFALKLKEIPYIHAEGMMGGELKHGTIALVEEGTPVISLISNGNHDMMSNTNEVKARGARTIIISNTGNGDINLENSCDVEFSIYASLVGHLLSYYIASLKGLPIDKPRNLAKSVTVK